jgi:hypothetical protein
MQDPLSHMDVLIYVNCKLIVNCFGQFCVWCHVQWVIFVALDGETVYLYTTVHTSTVILAWASPSV